MTDAAVTGETVLDGAVLDEQLRLRLDAIVSDILEVPAGSIGPDQRFIEELGADSLMFVEVLADIEEELNVVIAPTEMLQMTTLAGIYRVVGRLQ